MSGFLPGYVISIKVVSRWKQNRTGRIKIDEIMDLDIFFVRQTCQLNSDTLQKEISMS